MELLPSLPEVVRMSSLLLIKKAGDEVRERWEWQVSVPLDGEGERAGPHWAGVHPTVRALACFPPLALLPPAATGPEMAAVGKPCWGHVAWPWQGSLAVQAFTESNGSPDSQQILYPVAEIGKKLKWAELTYLLPFYSTAVTFSTTRTSLKIKEIEN